MDVSPLTTTSYHNGFLGLGDSQDPTKTLKITNCSFRGNQVGGDDDSPGGAVVGTGGVVIVHDSLFQENTGEYLVNAMHSPTA